jgi:hypothetical protein
LQRSNLRQLPPPRQQAPSMAVLLLLLLLLYEQAERMVNARRLRRLGAWQHHRDVGGAFCRVATFCAFFGESAAPWWVSVHWRLSETEREVLWHY